MAFRRSFLFFFLLSQSFLSPILANSIGVEEKREEDFSEELLLKPLPDRKTLAHFHFQTTTPPTNTYGRHHRLFPKALYQLVHKFRIREMELSFTQGRWNYKRWGSFHPLSSANAKPPGVELWALFDVPLDQVDLTWKKLTHALSGLFCASINFLDSSTAYSAPDWGFRSHSGYLRYGALPREAVCTENLTPWLKLLPCRDKAGLAAIMDRPSIYRGFYHSQRLRLFSTEFEGSIADKENGIILQQTLTVVLQPDLRRTRSSYSSESSSLQPNWSISSLFGKQVMGKCVLAKFSSVFIELEKGLVSEVEKMGREKLSLELSVVPDKIIREVNALQGSSSSVIYEFFVEKYSDYEPLDVGIMWKRPVTWLSLQAPFHASRFLIGSGNERGAISISLKSVELHEGLLDAGVSSLLSSGAECIVRVVIFQIVPWYVRVYYHTLQIYIDGQVQAITNVVDEMRVLPSEDKLSPGMMEMMLKLPCGVQSAALTLEFDKAFLHIDEYPPDANQGFDIPSAVVSFPDFHASVQYSKDTSSNSPLLSRFQEKNIVQSYTEVLLVPLTTPDFSMPYNVITFTCTVLALYFGSLLNILRRRFGEEERLLKSKAAVKRGLIPQLLSKLSAKWRGSPKLLKVVLVAVFAVGWHYVYNQ